jgi:hypothetical protein
MIKSHAEGIICRTDSPLGNPGESGTVLAHARTRPFDVLPYQEYTAARMTFSLDLTFGFDMLRPQHLLV